jgi:hypothetical protein
MNTLRLIISSLALLLLTLSFRMAAGAETKSGTPESLYAPAMKTRMFLPDSITFATRLAGSGGYDFNDVNEIKRAAVHPEEQWRRRYALQVLTYRIGGEAKGMLRTALADPYVSVRCDAARLLAILGDPNGLASMRKDFAELTKQGPDPNGGPKTWEERNRSDFWATQANGRLANALDVATVLAEFGDTAGYRLASQTVLQSQVSAYRSEAARILAELGKLPDGTLKANNCDPDAVLIAMLEKETDSIVLSSLRRAALAALKPASVVKVFEKMEQSPLLTDQDRRIVKSAIGTAKKRLAKEAEASNAKH